MLLAVNYHYVAEEPRDSPSIVPVTTATFAGQLDELARTFEFVSGDDVVDAIALRRPLPEHACLITFDDGLREQVELALPILEERGVPALFFVCGEPLETKRVLYVHKVHHLREVIPDEQLLGRLEAELAETGVASVGEDEAAAMYRYDSPLAARLKYLLNVVLGPTQPDPIDRLFGECFDEADLWSRLYLSPHEVAELSRKSLLGAHTYTHRPLAVLGPEEARSDVERGAAVLERLGGSRPRVFSYPYGGAAAVDAETAQEVAAAGFVAAFTMERAFNHTLEQPLLLARVDTNDAPAGKSPLFAVDETSIRVSEGMSAGRRRYLEEAA